MAQMRLEATVRKVLKVSNARETIIEWGRTIATKFETDNTRLRAGTQVNAGTQGNAVTVALAANEAWAASSRS